MPVHILIADDYDDNRELLRLMLETEGYHVSEARNGRECVELARTELPDLLLIDLSMPVLNGLEALREIRADARACALCCVAVTAFASEQDKQQALNAGFDGYLIKPFRSRELLDLIKRLLGERASTTVLNKHAANDGTSA